jgi:regulatory protein
LTESRAYLAALRILTRSDRSLADLGNRLRQKNYPEDQIQAALERCLELGYLNDRKLAARLSRDLVENGRAVGRRLLQELKKKGIPQEIAEQAAQEAGEQVVAEQQIAELLQRRFPDFDPHTAEQAQRRRIIGFFQRRGYRIDEIFSAFDHHADRVESDRHQE